MKEGNYPRVIELPEACAKTHMTMMANQTTLLNPMARFLQRNERIRKSSSLFCTCVVNVCATSVSLAQVNKKNLSTSTFLGLGIFCGC